MTDFTEKTQALRERLAEISLLNSIGAALYWDQATYMPRGGAAWRGKQLAYLTQQAHARFTDPALGKLLDELMPYAERLPADSDEAALIRVTHREYQRAIKVPAELVAAISQHASESYQAWTVARPADDFARMQPYLERTLDLSCRYAECFAPYDHIADPLIDSSDYGMKAADIRAIFADLRAALVPLAQAITAQAPADDTFLHQHYAPELIERFTTDVIKRFGYDFERGRLDRTAHPFAIRLNHGDVRITTRYPKDTLSDPLFSTLHEAGHAMYEQGVKAEYEGTPLAGGTSAGVHESQSRLWENLVGRSYDFWEYFYPLLRSLFPEQLAQIELEQFYRAINKVERSLIRTEADEVTYNLHVMIRFDFELQLLEGSLRIADLPEAWHARYQADLGVRAPDDRDGVLQDVHWFSGLIGGAFQGYTLGNILGAQFYAKALSERPEIAEEIKRGTFSALHSWLQQNIYQHGSKYTAPELIARTVGRLDSAPYINYLRQKYGALYRL
ncbi:MAG: carboxypeptidase M32 [Chloroflexota bacterium]|jgi:carboxypeptidase Taq|nr:MAG: carboxypeptidase M32 [Chloroflexota bacterium]